MDLGPQADAAHPAYLNWDHPSVPPRLRRAELPPGEPLLLLDEIHKYGRWRNLLKGIYDTERSHRRLLVTGSARLDYYRKGGIPSPAATVTSGCIRSRCVSSTRGRRDPISTRCCASAVSRSRCSRRTRPSTASGAATGSRA